MLFYEPALPANLRMCEQYVSHGEGREVARVSQASSQRRRLEGFHCQVSILPIFLNMRSVSLVRLSTMSMCATLLSSLRLNSITQTLSG